MHSPDRGFPPSKRCKVVGRCHYVLIDPALTYRRCSCDLSCASASVSDSRSVRQQLSLSFVGSTESFTDPVSCILHCAEAHARVSPLQPHVAEKRSLHIVTEDIIKRMFKRASSTVLDLLEQPDAPGNNVADFCVWIVSHC